LESDWLAFGKRKNVLLVPTAARDHSVVTSSFISHPTIPRIRRPHLVDTSAADVRPIETSPAAPRPKRVYYVSRRRDNKLYYVCRIGVRREWIERLFRLASTASDEEVEARAYMLRNTMMDYGDIHEWKELNEYLELRQQWPALYERWVANKDHPDGTEWAVFDKPGKIEFVRGGFKVTDSIVFPNQSGSCG
jgi:hypothetical protein